MELTTGGHVQGPSAAPLTCTHAASAVTNTGEVARCKYTWDSWGNSGATATRSRMSRCISVANSNCVYNPFELLHSGSISAGWERSAARTYTSTAEIAAPTDWDSAETFDSGN